MFLRISLFLLILYAGTYSGQQFGHFVQNYKYYPDRPPYKLTDNKEHEMVLVQRLHHLNTLIFKDVILKIKSAEKLQETYKGSLAYELGIITAGMLENFREMLTIYAYHTNMTMWRNMDNTTITLFNAYHAIHGRYMQILTEKDLYLGILQDFLTKQRKRRDEVAKKRKEQYEMQRKDMMDKQAQLLKEKEGKTKVPGLRMGKELVFTPPSDEEYKRLLRLRKWGEKWNNFDPEREGINIDIKVDVDAVRKAMKMKNNDEESIPDAEN